MLNHCLVCLSWHRALNSLCQGVNHQQEQEWRFQGMRDNGGDKDRQGAAFMGWEVLNGALLPCPWRCS